MQRTRLPAVYPIGLLLGMVIPALCFAAPNVNSIDLRGLQIGGTTTVILNGSELLPNPILITSFPIAGQSVKPSSKPGRIEIEVLVAPQATPGIYQLRVANGKGVSNPVVIGLDHLPQRPFAAKVDALPIALHGKLTGTETMTTRFRGTKGQRVVADVESQRLGAQLKPVVRIKDSRGRQIAWSPTLQRIAGDARVELQLPADDDYTVELHDVLYRGAEPGFFRLKLGELTFADLSFPLGVQAGSKANLNFASTNIPSETAVEVDATSLTYPTEIPARLPADAKFSGGPPRVVVSQHPELVEQSDATGMRQVLPVVPVAISGRIGQPKEEDQFAFPSKPGSRLRINVFAQTIGSSLDGTLAIRDTAGNQLATNDDRPGNPDPGLELQVPESANQLVVAIRDLLGRGGADFVYRIEISDAAAPEFSILAESDRVNLPVDGTETLRVQVNRANYNGKIKLAFQGLPPNVQVTGDEVLEGDSVGLLTISASGGSPVGSLGKLLAQATLPDMSNLTRLVMTAESKTSKRLPWLREEIAVAVTEPSPVRIAWAGPVESPMLLGEKISLPISVVRSEGATAGVKLRLLTTQQMPRKKVKENNREQEVDDVERALRLDGEVAIAADAKQVTANVVIPADLPIKPWGLIIAADVLDADNKTVVATTTTKLLTKTPIVPFQIELAAAAGLEAKAGGGETGKLTGKVRRQPGFTKPVVLTLDGLPKEYSAPKFSVAADKEDFEFPISFAFGAKPAELKDAKVVALYQPDPKNAELLIRSSPVTVGVIKVVPGEPPPPSQLLAVFEDDEKFIGYLSKGNGQISLDTQDKY